MYAVNPATPTAVAAAISGPANLRRPSIILRKRSNSLVVLRAWPEVSFSESLAPSMARSILSV